MSATPCQLLDDYIAHDLTGDERASFEAHLPECGACQRAVQDQKDLATLLKSAVERLEPIPCDLVSRTERRLHCVRRRRVAVRIAALAASVVLLVLLGQALWRQKIEPPAPTTRDLPQPRLADVGPPKEEVRVRFPTAARVIAVPVASDSPHVTLVQVYPGSRSRPFAAEMKKGGFK